MSKSVYSPTSKLKVQPDTVLLSYDRADGRGTPAAPALLEAINRSGLVFFLLVSAVLVVSATAPREGRNKQLLMLIYCRRTS